ncbi:hypothetical protein B0T25DRAFT_581929 [Lasiosphaeria hispida]|uniref:ABC transmembrane type-1 domain-containing protein n=1 Tax=Lasiosphaeria hispida TaxID=260671 RepID=A0AAJ0HDM2_9PEZI|nr:hypothetical protein B0T25DRAFT_581929 [Lasiosphaeria hispida]
MPPAILAAELLRLLIGACLVICVGADAEDDFSNNLFTDSAPLLALFVVPLGIITAIIGAIRVGGLSWLKTIIGRARESRVITEAELMSFTSKEICELWNGQEIVRVIGVGLIREVSR